MADRGMKALFEDLEPDVEEMDRYRRKLAARLGRPRAGHRWATAALLAAAVSAAWLGGRWLLMPDAAGLDAELRVADLETIEAMAATATAVQLAEARELVTHGSSTSRWNAIMLLSLAEPGESGVRRATVGLAEDPRASFRYAYLELLLDRGDEYRYRAERVEELMDQETSLEVWQLFRELYRIAS